MDRLVTRLTAIAWGAVPCAILAVLIPVSMLAWTIWSRYDTWERAAISSADAAQITANTYSEVGYATRDTLEQHVGPAVDELRTQIGVIGSEVAATNRTIRREVAPTMGATRSVIEDTGKGVSENLSAFRTNQDAVTAGVTKNLDESARLVGAITAKLEGPELEQLLADLAATGHRVRVVVEDPAIEADLRAILSNANRTTEGLANVTVELGGTAATVHRKIDETLYPPPPKGFWGKVGRAFKVTAGYLTTGLQAGYYLVRIAQ